ncbi:hypothetical protein C8R45DRAFT_1107113 [Mycena sanguinolenta]|nr:hypothetical protein C8R45DRAFT_1107113 [Mycena sanguinolenta]
MATYKRLLKLLEVVEAYIELLLIFTVFWMSGTRSGHFRQSNAHSSSNRIPLLHDSDEAQLLEPEVCTSSLLISPRLIPSFPDLPDTATAVRNVCIALREHTLASDELSHGGRGTRASSWCRARGGGAGQDSLSSVVCVALPEHDLVMVLIEREQTLAAPSLSSVAASGPTRASWTRCRRGRRRRLRPNHGAHGAGQSATAL